MSGGLGVRIDKLSDLTPSVVDHIYGTATATPRSDPTFILLVGSPGVGKSSGHAFAIKNGFLPADGDYATINLDTLLESLTPFRAGSAISHIISHTPSVRDHAKFSAIQSYGSRQENLGSFKWYNAAHSAMKNAEPELINALNGVRKRFLSLSDIDVPKGFSLIDINEAAIERAIERSVPIIYETTLTLNKKEGRVKKMDDLMALLADRGPQYRVILIHMTAPPDEIAVRVHHRQEFGMPYEEHPFYRHVSAEPRVIAAMARGIEEAVSAIKEQYSRQIDVISMELAMNTSRLAAPRNFNRNTQLHRVRNAYRSATNSSHRKRRRTTHRSSSNSHRGTYKKSRTSGGST